MTMHTLLVVDDEPDIVASLQELLRREFRVLGATSGEEGAAVLAREEVHVVMTDQRMPGMSGVELLQHARGEHPEAIRILFTGYADLRDVVDAINLGKVYYYLAKPWDPDALVRVVREAVAEYDRIAQREQQRKEIDASVEAIRSFARSFAEGGEPRAAPTGDGRGVTLSLKG